MMDTILSMKKPASLRRVVTKMLLWFFAFQLLIGLGFVVKSFYAGQDTLHSALLTQQANAFLYLYQQNPATALARSASFSVYIQELHLPVQLRQRLIDLPAGLHNFDQVSYVDSTTETEVQVLIMSQSDGQRLYFISQVPEPDDIFLMLDKTLGFILSYLIIAALVGMAFIWLLRRHLLYPLQNLVNKVDAWDFDEQASEFSKQFAQGDLGVLASSLDDLSLRLAKFVRRERKVTRNISHELRTPITVIRSTLDMMVLNNEKNGDTKTPNDINKLKRACTELEAIIHAILWLGRESWLLEESMDASAQVTQVIADLADYPSVQGNPIQFEIQQKVQLNCPDILFRILVSNLIRNALEHGQEKSLSVILTTQYLQISNVQNKQLPLANSQHFGLGLDIVKQICKRVGWQFEFCLEEEDVKATITF